MPTKQQIITIGVLCVVALGLGYLSGMPEKDSGQRAEASSPTIITNVVTNIVRVLPPVKPNPKIEKAIRRELQKPTGELTKADWEKVTRLDLGGNQLTEVPKELEKLTQLTSLNLAGNQLTSVKGLEKLTQLEVLGLGNNQLTEVPKELEKLTQLKTLYLSVNKLTDVTGLEKLTQLKGLNLRNNPDLTIAQIAELQKALPNCKISSDPDK